MNEILIADGMLTLFEYAFGVFARMPSSHAHWLLIYHDCSVLTLNSSSVNINELSCQILCLLLVHLMSVIALASGKLVPVEAAICFFFLEYDALLMSPYLKLLCCFIAISQVSS